MAENETEVVRANVKRVLAASPVFTCYYSNDTQVQTTPWDVRLSFGLITDVDTETSTATIERQADVRISLPHAKRLLAILAEQLKHYEAHIGPIPLPVEKP